MLNISQGDRDASRATEDDSNMSDDGELEDDSGTEQEVDQSPPISALISMGLPAVSSQLILCFAYAKQIQSVIEKYGAVISSNGRSKVTVDEVQEHMVIPDYPHTKDSATGILHIINIENPMPSGELNSNEVNNVFTQLMSKVCLTYSQSVLGACSS